MDDDEFRQRILAELDAVYRLACHLTRDRQASEDLVQETYLRALRSAGTFTLGGYGVKPWLFKILHNVILTQGAKTQRERAVLSRLPTLAERGPNDCDPPPGGIDWQDVDERLKAAVDELPLPQRVTFLLSVVEELKYREIADVTEVPVGTVMSRLSRARVFLAARLADMAAEQGLDVPPADAQPPSPSDDRDKTT